MLKRQVAVPKRAIRLWAWSMPVSAFVACAITLLAAGSGNSVAPKSAEPLSPTSISAPTETPSPTVTPTPTSTPTPVAPSSTPTVAPVQPLNGQELLKVGPAGPSPLTIKNGTTQDAVVKLVVASTNKTVRTVYVVRQSDWTITGIAPQSYLLRFALGNDWDPVLLRFQRNASFSAFDEPLDFEYTGGQYTTWTVTLNPVIGGTAEINKIDPATFYQD